jgi:hypothetical protein
MSILTMRGLPEIAAVCSGVSPAGDRSMTSWPSESSRSTSVAVAVTRGEDQRDARLHHLQRLLLGDLDLADLLAFGRQLLLELERAVEEPDDARADDDQSEVVQEEHARILGDEAPALLLLRQLGRGERRGAFGRIALALGFRGRTGLRLWGGGRLVLLALAVRRRRLLGSLLHINLLDRRLDAVLGGTDAETHGYVPRAIENEFAHSWHRRTSGEFRCFQGRLDGRGGGDAEEDSVRPTGRGGWTLGR